MKRLRMDLRSLFAVRWLKLFVLANQTSSQWGIPLKMTGKMKKILTLIAAMAAFVACSKVDVTAPDAGIAQNREIKIDEITNKYTESFERFSNSKSGNVVLEFILFKRNLMPYTFEIVYVIGVLVAWAIAIMGIFAQGPIGAYCTKIIEKDGKDVTSFNFILAVVIGAGIFVVAPFALHYVMELITKVIWPFLVHVYEKVMVPIWNTLIVRFLANVLPQIFPFGYERTMKFIDICIDKLEPFLDAVIDLMVAGSVTMIAMVKGFVWLPGKLGQRLGKWVDKANEGAEVSKTN